MMIGSARMIEDLYYFDDSHARNKQAQGFIGNVCSNSVLEQIILWHNRLGRPNFFYLKYLFPYLFEGVDFFFWIIKNLLPKGKAQTNKQE